MAVKPLKIGIYGSSDSETVHRCFSGLLRYTEEKGGLIVRDFTLPMPFHDSGPLLLPPWTGLVDGVVVSIGRDEGQTDQQMADRVLSGGVPAVSVAADWKDPRVPCFFVNAQTLGRLAAQHLMECGSQSFIFVGYSGSTGSPDREAAFRESLVAHGRSMVTFNFAHRMVGSANDQPQIEKEQGLVELIAALRKPVGIWALNDNFARAVCVLCEQAQLEVPELVKVLGVDDISVARNHQPSISSIHTPRGEIGYLAMRTLHAMILGRPNVPRQTEVDATELVARVSTLSGRVGSADMLEAVDYISRHACSGLTVKHLVERMDVSRRTFEARFRSVVGHSPGEEIQRVRLNRSKELLRQTLLSIGRISAMVGFAETAAFSKFFRSQTGFSPRDYREQALAEESIVPRG